MKRTANLLLIYFAVGNISWAQLLTNLSGFRNQVFVNSGYYQSFANYSFGWIHNERIKFLKRDVASFLDVSLPYQQSGVTKFVFRKGVQATIWGKEDFKIPLAIIGSSDKEITRLFRIHDFVTDFFVNPGLYRKRYTIAMEFDYKVIWFTHYHSAGQPAGSPSLSIRQTPNANQNIHSKVAIGIALGLNYRHFTWLLRTGYQQLADISQFPIAFYGVFQMGYNCNFKKDKTPQALSKTGGDLH